VSTNDPRRTRIAELNQAIGHRTLVWFGIRGEDAAPLLALDAFGGSFSVTSQLGSATLAATRDLTLEGSSGVRVDLDRYDLDFDPSAAAEIFRNELVSALSTDCVLVTYRPSRFTSDLAFSMEDTLTLAGMYKDRQLGFEHKPWVETRLAGRGIRTLDWGYVADARRSIAVRRLESGPLVLRANRDSGGVGITLVKRPEELEECWPTQSDSFVAVARYLEDAIPVNLSGCVFADGSVSCHPPSVQLIGIESMTSRPFGYCGNDFGLVKDLTPSALDNLQDMLLRVGSWLHDERYLGAFGIDALVRDDDVYFTEVNARMQGSTALSAQIAQRLDFPDLVLDHVAASLRLGMGYQPPTLREWVSMQPDVSHLVVHNSLEAQLVNVAGDPDIVGSERWTQDPTDLTVDPGGVLGRLIWPDRITCDGFSICDDARLTVDLRRANFAEAEATICV